MPTKLRWFLAAALGVLYGMGVLWATGLVPEWGRWFQKVSYHRAQTRALLRGDLAVSHRIEDLRLDHCWVNGRVQQVWGLGVSVWRTPLEVLSQMIVKHSFPDYLALGAFLALVATVFLRVLDCTLNGQDLEHAALMIGGAFVIVFLFPPFLGLLASRGAVWEETVAYAYGVGVLMAAGLIALAGRPTAGNYLGLSALSGMAALVRPTLWVYGACTMVVATAFIGRARWTVVDRCPSRWPRLTSRRARLLALGWLVCLAAAALVPLTNWLRFGAPSEFGHRLNVQPKQLIPSLYATRFDYPFREVPWTIQARELLAWLFGRPRLNGSDYYAQDIHRWQADVPRWRESYFTTYNEATGAAVAVAWVWCTAVALCRMRSGPGLPHAPTEVSLGEARPSSNVAIVCARLRSESPDEPAMVGRADVAQEDRAAAQQATAAVESSLMIAGWSLSSAGLLFIFYSRTPVISSRYLLDFGPAFAGALLAAWLLISGKWRPHKRVLLAGFLVLGSWYSAEAFHLETAYGGATPLRWNEVEHFEKVTAAAKQNATHPKCVYRVGEPFTTRIPFNGTGWLDAEGTVAPCVVLFVTDPEFLELEVAPGPGARVEEGPVAWRAKVGLEFLQRQRMERTREGWRLVFAGPRRKQYQRGLQPVFLATVPKEQLAEPRSPWRLLRVRWREETPTPSTPREAP
ncbi:MAG: hypothetical protein D6766_01995 [Verrucomicrobia bacterium]|nr:MAG: hypothetical protein D6766_01995 [Verrucomicrobiota bacterium]